MELAFAWLVVISLIVFGFIPVITSALSGCNYWEVVKAWNVFAACVCGIIIATITVIWALNEVATSLFY